MSNENKILSNLKYGFINHSNYDVTQKEVEEGIWDVPYFPAQNLVTDSPINIYTNDFSTSTKNVTNIYFPDAINNRLYRVFNGNDESQRLLFLVFDDNSRWVEYRFGGTIYPSGRQEFSYTYDGIRYFYINGGEVNGRCRRDIWRYDVVNKVWEPIIGHEDISSNFIPGRRKGSSILKTPGKLYIAGGQVDSEIGDVYITLNDVWEYDEATNSWTRYDKKAQLPRVKLNLLFADDTTIYLLANNKDLYQIDKATDAVTKLTTYTTEYNVEASFFLNSEFIVSVRNSTTGKLDWYKFDATNQVLVLYKESVLAVDDNQNYWVENYRTTRYGEIEITPVITVFEPQYKSAVDDSVLKTCNIKPIPNLKFMNYTMLPNNKIFFFSGFINGQLAENTWIFDGNTVNIEWMVDTATANTMNKPNERYAAALCYDNWHNRVWLFGGYDGSTYYNDLWYFDLTTKEWVKVRDNVSSNNTQIPAPRANMDIEFVQGYIYLVAGSNDVESFNDFWRYDIANDRWEQVKLVDKIPFGTTYKLFRYRDRLWLFNGSTKGVYRYFYNEHQFILQPIYEELNDELKKLQQMNVFLEFPIQVQCMEEIDRVYIWSGGSTGLNYLVIDLRDKRVIGSNFTNPVIPKNRIYWLTPAYYIVADTNTEAYLGYYNVSEFQGLTINEMPNPLYYGFNFNNDYGGCDGTSFYLRNPITRELNYFDNSGIFKVDEQWLQTDEFYRPDNYQSELFFTYVNTIDKDASFPYYDQNQQLIYTTTKEIVENYKNVYPTFRFLYRGAMFEDTYVKYAEVGKDKKYYILPGGKYANAYRYSPATYSWFKYHTEIWEGAAVAYDSDTNMLYAFGGILGTGKIPYDQYGIAYQVGGCTSDSGALGATPNLEEFDKYVQELGTQVSLNFPTHLSENGGICVHNGLMIYDLNYASMQVNYLKDLPENIVRLDYDEVKNYLIEYIKNNNIVDLSQVDLDRIQQQFYQSTQQIIDDLSKRDVYSEGGIRPTPRAFASSYYDKNTRRWYILGGVHISVNCKGLCSPMYKYEHVYQDLWVFNTAERVWKRLKNIPVPVHSASMTMTPDRKYLVVIGGLSGKVEVINQIWLYHIETDSWHRLEGVPSGFVVGAKPSLHWLEDNKLMIGYSVFYTYEKNEDCPKLKIVPYKVSDSYWIWDYNENVMYKAFESLPASHLIMVDDPIGLEPTKLDVLVTRISQKKKENSLLAYTKLYKHDLATGKYRVDKYYFIGDNGALSVQDITGSSDAYFMKIFYAFKYKTGNIIAVYNEQEGIRIYEFNTQTRTSKVLVIDYPIPAPAKLAVYDGKDYLYVIWNGYNIWRLDLNRALNNAPGDYWLQLPPFPDLNDLEPQGGRVLPNGQLVIYNNIGLILRFKPDTYAWFLESKIFPEYLNKNKKSDELVTADTSEYTLYYVKKGTVFGRYYDIIFKQFDKFYFDARRLKVDIGDSFVKQAIENNNPEESPQQDSQEIMQSILHNGTLPDEYKAALLESLTEQQSVTIPDFENILETIQVRRSRIYTVNALGHILYSWIRKYGHFKGQWNLEDFIEAETLRIYADLKVLNAYNNDKSLFSVKVENNLLETIDLTNNGTVVINEIDWFYDERKGMYRKDNPDGSYVLTKYPPNYIEFPLPANQYFRKIFIEFKPEPKDYSYIARINKVELISTTDDVILKDINPVDEVLIQPFDTSTSPVYSYKIQNTSTKTAYNIKVYLKENEFVEFSLDGTNWTLADVNNPFLVAEQLDPNAEIPIYIRVKKINRPIKEDIVILSTFEI